MALYLRFTYAIGYRRLSGTVIVIAVWAVAIDLLGASGRQGMRALILNGANVLGSGLIAVATWLSAPRGTFLALYVIKIGIAIAAWSVLISLARRSREAITSGEGSVN